MDRALEKNENLFGQDWVIVSEFRQNDVSDPLTKG
jgi:hypothetical protein